MLSLSVAMQNSYLSLFSAFFRAKYPAVCGKCELKIGFGVN